MAGSISSPDSPNVKSIKEGGYIMIDSTNPRILADNIRHLSGESGSQASDISALQTTVEALGSYSTIETDSGKKWIDDSTVYRKVISIGEVEASTASTTAHEISNLGIVINYNLIAITDSSFMYPIIASSASYIRQVIITDTSIVIKSASNAPALSNVYCIIEYTKSASPAALTSPASDDTRSIEPEVREEEPEAEPIIEEPVVEVKKTTRKKITTE